MLTDEEMTHISAHAVAARMAVPFYLVQAGMQSAHGDETTRLTLAEKRTIAAEMLGSRRLLTGLATNLNQLAMVANATGSLPPELPAAVAATVRVLARLDAIHAELEPLLRRR